MESEQNGVEEHKENIGAHFFNIVDVFVVEVSFFFSVMQYFRSFNIIESILQPLQGCKFSKQFAQYVCILKKIF